MKHIYRFIFSRDWFKQVDVDLADLQGSKLAVRLWYDRNMPEIVKEHDETKVERVFEIVRPLYDEVAES